MKNFLFNFVKIKREQGHGGISYAMCFVAIVITCVLYSFATFNANLFVVEEILENGLHIVESAVLTTNQRESIDDDADPYEKELERMRIVSKCTFQNAWEEEEKEQIDGLGKNFQDSLVEQLGLVNNVHPGSGTLKNICGDDSSILVVGDVVIYEPVYDVSITRTGTSNLETEDDERYVSKQWEFETTYTVTGWIKYNLHYVNNVYQTCTKEICAETPKIKNGNKVEGATIEATLGASFAGLKNIFAGVSTTVPAVDEKGNVNMAGVKGGMFSNTPSQLKYSVQVTQAMDIVPANQDSRDVG